jgi:ribulose 1,5-bisphosphate synthetase/thiazole synthase
VTVGGVVAERILGTLAACSCIDPIKLCESALTRATGLNAAIAAINVAVNDRAKQRINDVIIDRILPS